MNYISSYCTIRNNKVVVNGQVLEEGSNSAFEDFIKTLYKKSEINYSPFYKMDNMAKLGFVASELLIPASGIKEKYREEEIAVVFTNASSSLETDYNYYETIKDKGNYFPSPAVFVYTLPNIVIGEICIKNKFKGENAFFVFDTFDPAFLLNYTSNLLDNAIAKCCLGGWIEFFKGKYEAFVFLAEKGESGTHGGELNLENLKQLYSKQ